MHGADGHGLQSVDLFGDFHGADFGSEGGAGTPDNYDGGNQRAKFARHGDGYSSSDEVDGAEAAKFVGALQGEDEPDEESDERKNGQRADTNVHGLRDAAM